MLLFFCGWGSLGPGKVFGQHAQLYEGETHTGFDTYMLKANILQPLQAKSEGNKQNKKHILDLLNQGTGNNRKYKFQHIPQKGIHPCRQQNHPICTARAFGVAIGLGRSRRLADCAQGVTVETCRSCASNRLPASWKRIYGICTWLVPGLPPIYREESVLERHAIIYAILS